MNIRRVLPVIGVIIFIYILTTLDVEMILETFTSVPFLYGVLCFSAVVPVLLMTNYEWQMLLKKQRISVTFLSSLKNILLGYFYGFITPGGFGAYTRTLYLQEDSNAPLQKCVANVVLLNTVDYFSLLLLGFIGGVLLTIRFPHLYNFLLLIIVLIGVVLILSYVFLLKKEPLEHVFNKIIIRSNFFNFFKDRLHQTVDVFYEDMPGFHDLLLPFALSIFGWIVRFTELYVISFLFGVHVSLFYFLAVIAIANIIGSLPVTIYGLGTREVTLMSLFSLFQVAPENTVSLSLFWFVIIWLFPSFLGGVIAVYEGRKKQKQKKQID